jgi:MFS family permease
MEAGRGADAMTTQQRARAYGLGVANGVLFALGMAFIDSVTVLPSFVSQLSDSRVAVGLVATVSMTAWFLPQLISAHHLMPRPYKRPTYIAAHVTRSAAWLAAILVVCTAAGGAPAAALFGFFVCYVVATLAQGMSGPAMLDIVAKTVPYRRLGGFWGTRLVAGGIGAIACGALVRFILSGDALRFAANYCLLFGLGLFFCAAGAAALASVPEPPGRVSRAEPLSSILHRAVGLLLEDTRYRRLMVSRLLVDATRLATPFYVVYCREVIGVPDSTIGTYLSVQMAGSVLIVPLWSRVNDRRGVRALLLATGAMAILVPLLATTGSLIPGASAWRGAVFLLAFFPLAAIKAGTFMGYTNYIFAIAPEERRPLYIGVHNTLAAASGFLPLAGGALIDLISFRALFAIAVVLGVAGIAATLRLPRIADAS